MTLPLTPASVVRGLTESPCTISLLAYSAELHPIGEQRQPMDGGGGPNGPPKSDPEPFAAPWGEVFAESVDSAWPGDLFRPNPTADLVGASREDVFGV